MTNQHPLKVGFLILAGCLVVLSAQQGQPSGERPSADLGEVADFSKSVQLYRSLCLQDFDDELAKFVYGMHGQPWIVKKLKIDHRTQIFLSMGYSPDSFGSPWLDPDPALIKAISSKRVRSVAEAKAGDIVVIIENVDWETSTKVSLAISTYHKDLGMGGIHGSIDVRLKFSDNKWSVADQGGCRMRKFKER